MKVQITQTNLKSALQIVSRIVGSRTTLPVLANVLINTESNRLKLATTNLEMGVTCYIGAKVEEEGDITIPARLFSEYIANLPDDTVEINTEGASAHITSGSYRSKINGISAAEFPSIPKVEEGVTIELPVDVFRESLNQVVGMAASDDSRPLLTGVYFHTKDGWLHAVATDSYRLAEKRVSKIDQKIEVVIPARTIAELLRILDDATGDTLTILVDSNQVAFRIDDIEIVSRLIDGQFPNYQQLIPETVLTQVTLATKELQGVTKITGLFARENAGSVTIKVDAGNFIMESVSSQVGENSSIVEAQVDGEDIEVALNSRYINEALAVINAPSMTFGLTGKVGACILRPAEDDSYLHIIMPLRS